MSEVFMGKQGVLSYRVERDETSQNLTALSGLAPYVDLMVGSGLLESIRRNVDACGEQGWTDHEIAVSLVLLNLAGGDCVDDLDHLNADKGFGKLLKWCESHGLSRRVRREMKRRWRKAKNRSVASPSAARRWLGEFHDDGQEKLRLPGKAFIPKSNEHLLGLRRVNSELVGWVQERSSQLVATLDLDATLVESSKSDALYCYQGYRAYQPLNVWWAEVCFVPDAIAFGKKAPVYRYLATRESLKNQPLPGLEPEQLSLPFQTVSRGGVTYKLFGVVTNLDWNGDDVIRPRRQVRQVRGGPQGLERGLRGWEDAVE